MRRLLSVLLMTVLVSVALTLPGSAQEPVTCDGDFHIIHEVPEGELNDVGFTSDGEGWAAGTKTINPDSDEPEHGPYVIAFDGDSYEENSPPHEPGRNVELQAIEVVSSNDVYVVGYAYANPNDAHAVAYHWDGVSWTEMPLPQPGDSSYLRGIVAVAPNEVWAVGDMQKRGAFSFRTFIVRYDGTTWERVFAPNPGGRYIGLSDVDASGPNRVWAVGYWGNQYPLLLRWDGTEWRQSKIRRIDFKTEETFDAIDVVTPQDIWIVGDGNGRSLALHRVGRRWVLTRFHDVSGEPWLRGVAVGSQVWTVGQWPIKDQVPGTFAARWDGDYWWESDFEGHRVGSVEAVTVDGSGAGWAVGDVRDGTDRYDSRQVIERACWSF